MIASPFKKAGAWWVLLAWVGGSEEAGPFDDQLDAEEMALRATEDA